MKLGLEIKIDVKKIQKERLYAGEKGTYLSLTTFIDTNEKDRFDNNGFISQSTSKEEREQGVKTPILGNVKVFYKDQDNQQQRATQNVQNTFQGSKQIQDDDGQIPF